MVATPGVYCVTFLTPTAGHSMNAERERERELTK
jgi:hypothetical protein